MTEFVHIAVIDKFIPSFVDFMVDHFEDFDARHKLLILGEDARFPLRSVGNIERLRGSGRHLVVWREMCGARKVFLHGLFDPAVARVLRLQPALLKKCYWLIWGGELYDALEPRNSIAGWIDRQCRQFVIRNVAHLVTNHLGDVEHAQQVFGAKGTFRRCFLYPSNVFVPRKLQPQDSAVLRVLVGNSATATNRHLEIFGLLAAKTRGVAAKIFVPLSYGDEAYAHLVESAGREMFGDSFVPLRGFSGLEDYLAFLGTIDIAIFNHRRQQAVGNIIQLLGLGKKVYMRPEVSTWKHLSGLGIVAFDTGAIELERIEQTIAESNFRLVAEHYSAAVLRAQWMALLEDVVPGTPSHASIP